MSLRDFQLYLMDTLKCWRSLHECIVVFMFLIIVSKGSACEAPSSPECFRRKADESVYICEWSMNSTESNVTFDVYFNNKTKFTSSEKTYTINEEYIRIRYSAVHIWVEARVGNSSCTSPRKSVVLGDTVKYEAPQNISMSWFKNNLNLSWIAAEEYPALAEIRFRRNGNPTEPWGKRTTNTTSTLFMCHVIVADLLKDSVYQVQVRHRSTQVLNPLWSDWSPVVTVPAELQQKPEVNMMITHLNGTRKVTLSWKSMPHAAAVTGLSYSLTQSSDGCPCKKKRHPINVRQRITTYVSLSAVNISLIARNTAGCSPPAILQVPAEPAADLKICEKTLLDENRKNCHEWYQLQDGDSRPEHVITLTARKSKKERDLIKMNIKDYVRYLYFEHRCDGGLKPQTVKACLFYQKEGVPLREPQDLIAISEKHTSAELSWKGIPFVDQRGFLTHHILCSVKVSSQDELKECRNISASVTKHRLENLTPRTKYNISLVGVTGAGEGPEATVVINTLPEKTVNVWWSLGLLCLFFFLTTMCTCILKRIKNKILHPVPTPVIPDFILYQPEIREFLEGKEEVDELTLHKHPEDKSFPEDAEEATVLTREWDDGTDEDDGVDSMMSEDECPSSTHEALKSSREGEMTDLEQVDNEIAMLIYRNGLVFDVKMDSP
ncbi:interleukin-12 receptor subunit beta-1 [Cyclopterus lumpus]|uniref:interleukin-12 receptor subunit beta-1 n=1 Tax=Cyclopterus lumpus TaxID=8103 RepID=UPI001486DCE1|nr:interleukin-12 receptor subunit beta-1 [Cyclopterus lumpus]